MAGRVNKYGFKDYIPADVRRAVRRDCGYGCVICGLAFLEYDHFDPPFEEAREHRADGIAALCGACHRKKSSGMWSVEKVAAARKNPITFRGSTARDAFDITPPFTLWIGSSSVENVSTIIKTHEGDKWLSIEAPEDEGGPMRISADFFDEHGAPSLTIEGNEWQPVSAQWDTEAEGRRITVRSAPGTVVLQLIAMPPHGLKLDRLRMRKGDLDISIDPSGQGRIARGAGATTFDGCSIRNADCVFLV